MLRLDVAAQQTLAGGIVPDYVYGYDALKGAPIARLEGTQDGKASIC